MATSGSKTKSIMSWIDMKFSWWQNSQSINTNSTEIGWQLELITNASGALYKKNRTWTVVIDGTTYTGKVDISLDTSDRQVVATGTATVKHNSDGSKTFSYSFTQQFELTLNSGKYMSTYTGSGTDTLNPIPRGSSISVPDGALRTKQTITVTPRMSGYTHSIKAVCGSSVFYINADGTVSDTETIYGECSIAWTPAIDLATQYPQSESVIVAFTIRTYNAGVFIAEDTDTATYAIPADLVPPLIPATSDPTGYADYYGECVQGKSKVKIDFETYGVYGSWIKSWKVTFDGKTYPTTDAPGSVNGNNITIETETITGSGELILDISVTDSRGRTTIGSIPITVLPYEPPTITDLSAFRSDNRGVPVPHGDHLTVKFSTVVQALNSKNSAWFKVSYKKSGATDETTVDLNAYTGQFVVTDGTFTFAADSESYDIVLKVGDRFQTIPRSTTGASATHTISMLKKNGKIVGIAFNKVADTENAFDIGFPVLFSGGFADPNFDHIVEHGEKDGWTYRRWNSGVQECYKVLEHKTAISKTWGSMYVGNTLMERQNYPLPFVSKPAEFASLASGNPGVWLFTESQGNGVNGAYATAIYNVCRPTSNAEQNTFYFSLYAIGKWK